MLRSATQDHRQLAVFTPFGKDVLLLESFVGEEALSELSEFQLRMISSESDLDPTQILGRNITFRVDRENFDSRFFNGYVRSFSIVDATDRMFVYEACVVPWLWFLTNTTDCRIFQKKTTPEIIEQIFRDLGFDDFDLAFLSGNYQPRDYCVQYRESDFDFVSRLLEEEGIYYYFVHENGKHTLVLADSTSGYYGIDEDQVSIAARTQQGAIPTDVFEWRHGKRMLTGRWASTDYNYSKPKTNLNSAAPSAIPALSGMQLERFDFPGRFSLPAEGRDRVQIRMEEEEAKHEWVAATGIRATFTPGGILVAKHANASEVGRKYAIRRVRYTAGAVGGYTSGDQDAELPWLTEFEGIPQSVVFRPERKTPRPIVEGPQTAVVVGPSGEEIYTDEDGRIKVQFHWDREGSRDENSSCWIRVSQTHAGAGWGAMHIPRIGEEVIVSFLEGDPDQPVVKGRVYNGAARVPFGLPGEMTRSGGKSNTHKGSGYNEMSMDDTAGKEQMRTNAQHNMDTTVGNSQTLGVGVDRSESIGNNHALTVGVNKTVDIGNNLTEAVGNNENLIAGNNVVLKAGTAITLKCGLSTIHMNQAGVITISGQYVSSLAAATNTIVAPMTEIAGSTMLNQAGAICMDLSGVKHIKAKETSVSGAAVEVHGKGITIIKGAPIKLGEAGAPMATIPAPTSAPGGGGPSSPSGPASTSSASGGAHSGGAGTKNFAESNTGSGSTTESPSALTDAPDGGKLIQKGNGEKVIVLVGGASDGSTGNVRDGLSLNVKQKNPDADIVYVGWQNDEEAAEWLEQYKNENPNADVQLIGHSWGGDSAMQIAELLEGKVDDIHVITLDPVAHWKTDRPPNVSQWDNIYVSGVNDETDIIAGVGGHWGHESKADSNTVAPANTTHADSVGMYKNLPTDLADLVRNPRSSQGLPSAISVPSEMNRQMDRMMEMSNQSPRDPSSGERSEFGAVIGLDPNGNLVLGPVQDLGPNGNNGFDPSKTPVNSQRVGSVHTHPGDDSSSFSNPDYTDIRAGDERVMIVQTNGDRFLVVSTSDTNYPSLLDPTQRAQELKDQGRLNSNDPATRNQANIDYANKTNSGYYQGKPGSTQLTKKAPK